MFNFFRRKAMRGNHTNERVRWVAASIKDDAEFKQRAATVAAELGSESIEQLRDHLHGESSPPEHLAETFPGLGEWLSARQHAIFEILYHFREESLPVLRAIAFGPYDWTQANAVDILCRLASEGIETNTIATEIVKDIPTWRYEAILSTIHYLTQLAEHAPILMDTIHEMIAEWANDDPIEALELIEPLAYHAPESARKHKDLLRGIMLEAGHGNRSPLADGQVVEIQSGDGKTVLAAASGPTHPSIPDYHAIRATLILHQLFPSDSDVLSKLNNWANNHPEQEVRAALKERLDG